MSRTHSSRCTKSGGRSGSGPVVAASDGDDPGDDQQQRKDHTPHEPAGHELPLSVVCEHDAALMRLLLTVTLRRTPARGVTPRRRGRPSPAAASRQVGHDGYGTATVVACALHPVSSATTPPV